MNSIFQKLLLRRELLVSCCLLPLLVLAFSVEAASIKGDYERVGKLPKANSLKRVEVVEFINFTCSHCHNFRSAIKPLLRKYGKRVKLVSIPLAFGGQSKDPIRLYFIAEKKGKGNLAADALFKATFVQKLNINSPQVIQQIAGELGLRSAYNKDRHSNWINKKLADVEQLALKSKIRGTPTIVLEKSIKIQARTTIEQFIRDLDKLIQQLLA